MKDVAVYGITYFHGSFENHRSIPLTFLPYMATQHGSNEVTGSNTPKYPLCNKQNNCELSSVEPIERDYSLISIVIHLLAL